MAISNLRRQSFDRDREFVVVRNLTIHGQQLGPGDPFNSNLVSTRRLRQMYESRLITMSGSAKKAKQPASFDPAKMSDAQLSLFLEDHGVVPRFGAPREWFVGKVRALLEDKASHSPVERVRLREAPNGPA